MSRPASLGQLDLPRGTIFEIAQRAGIEVPECGSKRAICCPFHDDKHPSAFLSGNNVFFCSRCTPDGGWTARQFAKALRVPWRDIHWHIGPSSSSFRSPASSFSPAEAREVWQIGRNRALDDEAVEKDSEVYRYLSTRGLVEAWEERVFGVLASDMDLPASVSWWPSSGYRIVVPLRDHRGQISNVQARNLAGGTPKTRFPSGSRARGVLFASPSGLEVLLENHDDRPVFLGEGLTDFLALSVAASVPVLSTPGTGMAVSSAGPWASGRSVFIALDSDDAGEQAAGICAQALYSQGAAYVYSVTWPPGCSDACDVVETMGMDGLTNCLEHFLEAAS